MMCQYGNCPAETKDGVARVRVTVTLNKSASRVGSPEFCCHRHAALWLLAQAASDSWSRHQAEDDAR